MKFSMSGLTTEMSAGEIRMGGRTSLAVLDDPWSQNGSHGCGVCGLGDDGSLFLITQVGNNRLGVSYAPCTAHSRSCT